MPLGAKTIRTRIRSVKNTSKITKAMEVVSANKMRKASKFALSGRPYDLSISEILESIASDESNTGQFFYKKDLAKKTNKILIILFSGNRGLCGNFNSQIISFTKKIADQKILREKVEIAWIPIGKKGLEALARSGEKIEVEFKKIESGENAEEFWNIGKYVTKEFEAGKFDEVWISYTDFVSPLKQIPRFKLLLPIKNEDSGEKKSKLEISFEPNKEELISYLVPRLIETKLYQALLESNASEHSSRMIAMKNASDACRDITDELVFQGNELRQSSITREIGEIAGAKAAINN